MALARDEFRRALGKFAAGVTVITTTTGQHEIHGMTANAFSSVSLDPPLILVCVDHRARSHPIIQARKRFGVNVLAEGQQRIADYFAHAAEDHQHPERAGAQFVMSGQGTPILEGCLAYLECRLELAHVAGDHTIFIAEVEEVRIREGHPLLYFASKYRHLVPPREP